MSSSRKRFLHYFAATRAVLTGILRGNGNCRHSEYFAKILYPAAKIAPCCITNRFSQVMILDHVANLQVFQHHEVVRLHHAPCSLYCKVSTLALYFQMRLTQLLDRLTAILGTFSLFTSSTLPALQTLFSFAKIARVFNSIAVRIGIEMIQAHIQPNRADTAMKSGLLLTKEQYEDFAMVKSAERFDPPRFEQQPEAGI
jgi:hypothetical protein